MTSHDCQLLPYGIIMKPDLVSLVEQIKLSDLFDTNLEVLEKGGVVSSWKTTRSSRKLPQNVAIALQQAGIYWTWRCQDSEGCPESISGIHFDAEAGRSIHYRCQSGTCVLDPMKLGQSRFPENQVILGRMLDVRTPQPLLVASSQHEALQIIRQSDLAPHVAEHCLKQRAQLRGLGKVPHRD